MGSVCVTDFPPDFTQKQPLTGYRRMGEQVSHVDLKIAHTFIMSST